MSDKKGWGATVTGWFIERDEPAAPVETDCARRPSPTTSPLKTTQHHRRRSRFSRRRHRRRQVVRSISPPFLQAAGVDQEEQQRVARTTDLLRSLPAGTDMAVKKQIVEASLKAFGVSVDKIIEATVEEIQALDGYIRNGAADNEKLIQESDARIKQYEQEIQNIRSVMQQSVEEQQKLIKVCNDKKLEVQQVLEFFGQDTVAKVVKASPKLHDPSDPAAPAN